MKKTDIKPSQRRNPQLRFCLFLLALSAVVLLAGAVYALFGAAGLKNALNDSAARAAALSVKAVLSETAAAYSDDLSSLHVKTDAQDTRFDELCALLSRTARNNNIDSLVTIARRADSGGYAYILDSRFSRKLTPNVDYHTVGAACDLRQEGGASLERLVSRIQSKEQEYGYVVAASKEGVPTMTCAFALYNSDGSALGVVLAHITGGLFAKTGALALPFYMLAALLLAASLITALNLLFKYRKAKRAAAAVAEEPVEAPRQEKPLTALQEKPGPDDEGIKQ
ncbi:hypothetical protein [Acetanaerobacterium elongatum]|uniref:hypothetical protein n=1 Tax=Acetanaerobacterium elongatum TaxID=258515 RepID=UPI000B8520BE|nr:hypothetical protein [Acetanaerobacterium elongatum]